MTKKEVRDQVATTCVLLEFGKIKDNRDWNTCDYQVFESIKGLLREKGISRQSVTSAIACNYHIPAERLEHIKLMLKTYCWV